MATSTPLATTDDPVGPRSELSSPRKSNGPPSMPPAQSLAPAFTETKPRFRWIGSVLFAGFAAAIWYYWPAISPHLTVLGLSPAAVPKPPPPRVTPVSTSVVEQRDLPLSLNALGTVTALKTVTIRSRVEGELTQIAFTEGQMVNEGDLLAMIDPRSYEVQKQQAEGQLSRDTATLRGAKLNLTRLQQLLATKIATAQQVDDQLALVQQYEGAVKADEAMIAQADLQLSYTKILAPICGRIGLRHVDAGNMVRPTDPQGLAVITQLQPIALVFTIPQDEIPRVQKWMRNNGTLTVQAYDRELRNVLATGKLLAIDNQVDPTNGTVRMKAEFDNSDGLLFPNQFVNVRLQVEELEAALVVPSAAVQRGPNGPFVYVVGPEETAELRPVEVAATEGNETAVSNGVAAGEFVVTSGLDRLQPNAKISTKTAASELRSPQDAASAANKRR